MQHLEVKLFETMDRLGIVEAGDVLPQTGPEKVIAHISESNKFNPSQSREGGKQKQDRDKNE